MLTARPDLRHPRITALPLHLAFVKRLAVEFSLAKDTLGRSRCDGARLNHPVVKLLGVISRPAVGVFHPFGRVACEIGTPHPWRVQSVVDLSTPFTLLIAPLLQHILEYSLLPS